MSSFPVISPFPTRCANEDKGEVKNISKKKEEEERDTSKGI
jgi:hypothetical protein